MASTAAAAATAPADAAATSAISQRGGRLQGRGRLAWRLLALGVGGAAGWGFVRLGRSASVKPRDGDPD